MIIVANKRPRLTAADDVIYPIAQGINKEADELEQKAAEDFINFLISDSYYFDINVT